MKCLNPVALPGSDTLVACGKCVNCCYNYSKEWSLRMYHEFLLANKVGMMLTLTYKYNPIDLNRKDVQDFLKRFRKEISPTKIRIFYCGEYGGKNNRPHYHLAVFGYVPDDVKFIMEKGKSVYFGSKFIENLWGKGFISIGKITIDSVKYVAKYLSKIDPRPHNVKPFTGMSLRPGLGAGFVKNIDMASGKLYVNGVEYKVPEYYLRCLEKEGYNVDHLRDRRRDIAASLSHDQLDFEEMKKAAEKGSFFQEKYYEKTTR